MEYYTSKYESSVISVHCIAFNNSIYDRVTIFFYRMLPEIFGNLYVGGYDKPFAAINVKVYKLKVSIVQY